MSYLPLINNTEDTYLGYDVKLGETAESYAQRPNLVKIGKKKILGLCVGASTPGQISTVLESKSAQLGQVQILNTCRGGQDINDWLNPESAAWSNLNQVLVAKNRKNTEVQFIIMCHDDLRSQATNFPADAQSLADKMEDLVVMLKSKFPALKQISLFSRLCEYQIADPKFGTPSGYHNGWANKFLAEKKSIAGVWITDADGYLYTDGENLRSDGFQFRFSWMKKNGTDVHLDTTKEGDDVCAGFIFDNHKKRYSWFA